MAAPAPRRACGLARGRPQQPDRRQQQQRLGQGIQQGVGVAAVMQQIAERLRGERGEHQVEVGEIAGNGRAGEQQAAARAGAPGIGLRRQQAVGQFAQRKAGKGMGQVIHSAILSLCIQRCGNGTKAPRLRFRHCGWGKFS